MNLSARWILNLSLETATKCCKCPAEDELEAPARCMSGTACPAGKNILPHLMQDTAERKELGTAGEEAPRPSFPAKKHSSAKNRAFGVRKAEQKLVRALDMGSLLCFYN